MAIEIVNFPIKNADFPYLCKRLPEGSSALSLVVIDPDRSNCPMCFRSMLTSDYPVINHDERLLAIITMLCPLDS